MAHRRSVDQRPLEQRPIARMLRAVDHERLMFAIRTLQREYNIPFTGVDSRGLPSRKVSSDFKADEVTGRPISGHAYPDHRYVLYEPGIYARVPLGFNLRLTVLEASLHELLHEISGKGSFPGSFIESGSCIAIPCTRVIMGFREAFVFNANASTTLVIGNEMFNEGVTQLLTLELMRIYLDQAPFLGVTKLERWRHFEKIRIGVRGTYYPNATSFVRTFAARIGEVLGSEEAALNKIFQDFFVGKSLQNDTDWIELMAAADIERVMLLARDSDHATLPVYEARLSPARSALREVWLKEITAGI